MGELLRGVRGEVVLEREICSAPRPVKNDKLQQNCDAGDTPGH
jgi:hypothetical protein